MFPDLAALAPWWNVQSYAVDPDLFNFVSVAPADPDRLYLAFSVAGGIGYLFSPFPDISLDVGVMAPSVGFLEIKYHDSGSLCQLEWFCYGKGFANKITVWSVSRRRPGGITTE